MTNKNISALAGAATPLAGTELVPIVQSGATDSVSIANLTAGRSVAALSFNAGTAGGADGVLNLKRSSDGLTVGTVDVNSGTSAMDVTTAYPFIKVSNYTGLLLTFGTGPANADATIVNNLIQGTAAKGINFTANTPAAGMTSQLLNWYEEGTWTPTILGGTVAGTPTYVAQVGSYTRVGRQVTLRINLAWSAISGSPSGLMLIGGLPFAYSPVFSTCPIGEQNLTHTAGSSLVVTMAGGGYSLSQFNLAEVKPSSAFTTLNIVTSGQVFGVITYFI